MHHSKQFLRLCVLAALLASAGAPAQARPLDPHNAWTVPTPAVISSGLGTLIYRFFSWLQR